VVHLSGVTVIAAVLSAALSLWPPPEAVVPPPSGAVPGSSSAAVPGSSSAAVPGSSSEVVPGSSSEVVPGSSSGAVPAGVWAAPRPGGQWAWPLAPRPIVSQRFAAPAERWSSGHRGVDLVAAPGQPVLAPSGGVVTFSGVIAGRGVVVVSHPGGLRTSAEPVEAALPVGSVVGKGQQVAVVSGAPPGHCPPTTCLHWGVLRGESYLDPLLFVGSRPVLLLPLDPGR